jgi:hypothetical protein
MHPRTHLAPPAISPREVPALAHEFRYHPVERAPLEVQDLPPPSDALLARAEAAEILGRDRDDVPSEFHLDPSLGRPAYRDVEEYDGILVRHGSRFQDARVSLTRLSRLSYCGMARHIQHTH